MPIDGISAGLDAGCLDQFIRLMADPIAIIDPNWLVIAANNAFLERLGYTEDDLARGPIRLFDGSGARPIPDAGDMEIKYRAKDGSVVVDATSISPIYGKEVSMGDEGPIAFVLLARRPTGKRGEDRGLIEELRAAREELARRTEYFEDFRTGVFRMVKELESSEEELESAYRLLKETRDQLIQSSKMTALGELASALAHELSQPLTIIKGLSQNMIASFDEGSPDHEKLSLINHAVKRMETVIKHLKIFSRKDQPMMEPIDLNRVINEAFVMVKGLLSSHSIEVRMDLEPLPQILGSQVRLEQVIINIITNARDAMPGGGLLVIKTRGEDAGGRPTARLSISDSGAGIPEENLKRVFDPFFTTKEPGKGTGIGLSISYGIIKEHEGEITVDSTPGLGTTFHITIPAIEKTKN